MRRMPFHFTNQSNLKESPCKHRRAIRTRTRSVQFESVMDTVGN
jgi:hypothetical protein